MRTRLPALVVAVVAMLAPLAVAAPAEASSPASWTCVRPKDAGKIRYRGQVKYTNNTGHRISINRVTIDDAYWIPNSGSARRIGLSLAGVLAFRNPIIDSNIFRDELTPEDWTGASAAFFWSEKWVRATTDDPLYVRIEMDSTAVGAGRCQAELVFWG